MRLEDARAYRDKHGHLPDGIFFGLTEEEHHADPALGSTDLKALLVNPVQWRWKKMAAHREALGLGDNPDKPEDTIYQAFGRAVDCLLTEPGRFDQLYIEDPAPPEGTLFTRDQMREAMGVRCMLPKSADTKAHEIECKRLGIRNLGCDWEADKAELVAGRTPLSRRWMATLGLINRMADMPRADYDHRSIRKVVLADGYPQVTVIWTDETGLRLKARFDWLRPSAVIDVKTYSTRDDQEPVEAFWGAVSRFCYDMQAAHYLDAFAQLARLVSNGSVYGEVDEGWLTRLSQRQKPPGWVWLGVQWAGMPEVDEFRFPDEMILGAARQQVNIAKDKYREFADRFAPDEPWVSTRGPITMGDITCPNPTRMAARGAERWRNA